MKKPIKNLVGMLAMLTVSSCVDPSTPQPSRNPQSNQAGQSAQIAAPLVGEWSFPQVSPEVSPVVMKLNADQSYHMESESAVFERGRWSLSGNQLKLSPTNGSPKTAAVQLLSKDKLRWDGKSVLERIP